jgi:hypothetical protein
MSVGGGGGMDEKKLAELLKDVVAETPPPTFTHADVTRESARQQQRRRNGLLAGSAFGVAVLAGATALSVALWSGGPTPSAVTSAEGGTYDSNETAAPYELPDEDAAAAEPTERGGQENFPPEGSKQGDPSDGNGGPAGSASTPRGCEQVDRELAAALAGELPAAANVDAAEAKTAILPCPTEGRGARFELPEGGQLTVLLLPQGSLEDVDMTAAGGAQASAPTSEGDQVLVVSEPEEPGGSIPYESDLSRFATTIAQGT